jgi:pimeloyl-ACP methyl ester carboxylesterase
MDILKHELPDLFVFANGDRVHSVADWHRRRLELRNIIFDLQYGGYPPSPASVKVQELCVSSPMKRFANAKYVTCKVTCMADSDRAISFILNYYLPVGEGPFPVVLTGDACWRNASDAIILEILQRGYIMALFNRVEIVPDMRRVGRSTGLYAVYPELEFGALSAWAWGYQRAIDALLTKAYVNREQIAVVGHSRGGKTVLLAGAMDERIAVVGANNSGAGGAGCYRWQGPKSETLADNMKKFPDWYCERMTPFIGKEHELPFDQHGLKALIAPRALLTLEAYDDLWANPTGTWQTFRAAQEVYRFFGKEAALGTWYRAGGHGHTEADWQIFMEFADWQMRGITPSHIFTQNPFPDLPPAHTWSAPVNES